MYTIEVRKRKNSRKYTPVLQFMNMDEVVKHVLSNNLVATIPYVFTHLELSDDSIIRQEVMGLTCSPMKLRDLLGVK